jgi:Holliday junction resolvasome RuvABC endonuclease subunit
LKELGGILWYTALKQWQLETYCIGVAQIKKYVTGKGNAEKDRMMLDIYKNFGVEPSNEHEADAAGVALTAFGLVTGQTSTKAQAEVVEAARKVDHPLTRETF